MTTRHDFYQTDNHLIVSIYKKGVPADKVRIEATPNQVRLEFVTFSLSPMLNSMTGRGLRGR